MRLGVVSDIHGVAAALTGVLDDGHRLGVDTWCALGDLVLFGPDPVEVIERLHGLADIRFVRGNTDRYVLTGDQPPPHRTPEAAAGDADLVRRYGLMAAGAAWTSGVLDQAGVLGMLDSLPDHHAMASRTAPASWPCTHHRHRTTARGSTPRHPTRRSPASSPT